MIASLEGTVSEKLADIVILEAGGVGYGVNVTNEDYANLVVGEKVKLYIYEHIREQLHDLYGFLNKDTGDLFVQLMGVSGVGPKMALSMLSIGSDQALRQAIAGGDTAFIGQAGGVGRRLAERVVVELKDKVGLIGSDLSSSGILRSTSANRDEAVEALVALGYSANDAVKALAGIDKELGTEERVKLSLKEISK